MRVIPQVALIACLVLGLAGTPGFAEDGSPGARDKPAAPKADKQPAVDPARPEILTLRVAARTGRVEASGTKPGSYQSVQLNLRNRTPDALRIDICGSYLTPTRSGSCQRLGLGPVVTPRGKGKTKPRKKTKKEPRRPRINDDPPGTVIVMLAPGEAKSLRVNTCCLDAGKPAPYKQTFQASHQKLPPVREKVLRWWADNPTAPQGSVNAAIWQFRDTVTASGRSDPSSTSGVAAHAGSVYMLRRGELMMRDPDGVERFLGTEILGVHPTDSAVYAEALGTERDAQRRRHRELWRLVPTGEEPWKFIARVPEKLEIRDVRVGPGGTILATGSMGLYRVDPKAGRFVSLLETKDMDNLSFRFDKRGRLFVTKRRPEFEGRYKDGKLIGQGMAVCELYTIDLKTGKKERVREFWNVRQAQAGPAGIYALTPGGKLRRRIGNSFKNAPGQITYERILKVATTCVWLESKNGRLVAVNKNGRRRFAAGPSLDSIYRWDLDPYTDDVVIYKSGTFYRVDPKRGERVKIERQPRSTGADDE